MNKSLPAPEAPNLTAVPPRPALVPARSGGGRVIAALILREMATTFGRSRGGWIWAVAEPVAVVALLSFAFSLAFRAPSLGTSFPLFYATGYLPFLMFQDVSTKLAQSLRFSRALMSYPRVTWFDALAARLVLNVATHLIVAALVLGAIAWWEGGLRIDPRALALALAMVVALAAGVGALNCFLFTAWPATERVWLIASRPLFIASGVFYLFEDLPGDLGALLWYNPLLHAAGAMRAGTYPEYAPDYLSAAYPLGLGLGLLALGLAFLKGRGADLTQT